LYFLKSRHQAWRLVPKHDDYKSNQVRRQSAKRHRSGAYCMVCSFERAIQIVNEGAIMTTLPTLGFIGLGAMGGPMSRNLLTAGYALIAFDPNADHLQATTAAGGQVANNGAEVVACSEIVLTSLPSSQVWVQVAEADLLPHARAGQIFIDLGTTTGNETRRLATALGEKGASLIDAPVSGGPAGAAGGNLRIFIGGDEAVVTQCRPILAVLGEPQHVVYCGPSGSGQVAKGVNQLAMGLGAAAYLEAIAYGVRGGVNAAALAQAIGGEGGWRGYFGQLAQRASDGQAEEVWVKFPELPYFLEEAAVHNFPAPLTQALFDFLDAGPRDWRDNMNRPTVSCWEQLLQRRTE
jgi:3-hydroxyisobutyrate dehydrogenase-like beta-hydroxyacid dehydrogenase